MREQQEGGRSPAMCPLGYYTVLRQSKEPTYLRLEMVRFALEAFYQENVRLHAELEKTDE